MQRKANFKFIIFFILLGSLLALTSSYAKFFSQKEEEPEQNLESNNLPVDQGLIVRSVDTQIVSKHWEGTTKQNITSQVKAIKALGANYIAISTPYNRPNELAIWAEEIHAAGLSVWFRSHWLEWEGDESAVPQMNSPEYLAKTSDFIKSHPSLFEEGDAFTVCVEPEQIFVVKKTNVFDAKSYNQFLIDQIDTANSAFAEIGLAREIHTNWISLNGWVAMNGLSKEAVEKMGVITVDHYPNQNGNLSANESALMLSNDLKSFYRKWRKPIILGEWGYNILREVSEDEQAEYVQATTEVLRDLDFLIGFNYWSHMGNNTRLFNDEDGKLTVARLAAPVLGSYFKDKTYNVIKEENKPISPPGY